MSKRTVHARLRLHIDLAFQQVKPAPDGDYKNAASAYAAFVLRSTKGDRKAHDLAHQYGIDPCCPRATLRAFESL